VSDNTEDVHLITEFSVMMHVKAQQIKARLRPFVRIIPMKGDVFAYDGIETAEAREIFGRYEPVKFDDIKHTRRKIPRRRFVVTLPIDESDVRGRMTDPQGVYAEASTRAMERQFDRVGIEAIFSNVNTGREFETSVAFAADGGNTVNATAGTTYEKLLELKKFWTNNEVGTDVDEELLFLNTGTEEESLMQEIELISGDFTRKSVVDQGRIVEGVGMKFITYGADVPNPLLSVSGGTRDCVGMAGRGLAYGLSKEFGISMDKRDDLVETRQVQITGEIGAVRTEGVLVQKFQTTA